MRSELAANGTINAEHKGREDWPDCDVHSSSDEYAKRFHGSVGEFFLDRQAKLLRKALPFGHGFTALDVGGGHGQLVSVLKDSGAATTILGSAPVCEHRVKQYVEQGICSFKAGNFYNLPFPDKSFDVVICFRQIAHVEDPNKLIQELCRVSKNRVIIDYPPLCSFNVFYPVLYPLKQWIEKSTRTFNIFRKSQLKKEFRQEGFHIIRCEHQFFVPMGVHRLFQSGTLSTAIEMAFMYIGLTNLFGSPVVLTLENLL